MVFLIESLVACALFTFFVFLMSRDPVKTIFNYPPAIIDRCRSLGLVNDSNRPGGAVQDEGYRTVGHIKKDGTVQDGSYRTVGHVREDGTVQDASYRTIGHASGIPMEWAAFYFFFHE